MRADITYLVRQHVLKELCVSLQVGAATPAFACDMRGKGDVPPHEHLYNGMSPESDPTEPYLNLAHPSPMRRKTCADA